MIKTVWLEGKCPYVLLSVAFCLGLWSEILTVSGLADAVLQSGLSNSVLKGTALM